MKGITNLSQSLNEPEYLILASQLKTCLEKDVQETKKESNETPYNLQTSRKDKQEKSLNLSRFSETKPGTTSKVNSVCVPGVYQVMFTFLFVEAQFTDSRKQR